MSATQLLTVLCLFGLLGSGAVTGLAHSGGLDARGGHMGKDGSYHLHRPVHASNTVAVVIAVTNQAEHSSSAETNAATQAKEANDQEAYAWDYAHVDLPAGSRESLFQEAYAKMIGGTRERKVKTGRIDVETDTEVFELDRQEKWKEGMGQALAYAKETGKKPVLVLISSSQGPQNMHKESREKYDMALQICQASQVRLVILFPTQPRPPPKPKQAGLE